MKWNWNKIFCLLLDYWLNATHHDCIGDIEQWRQWIFFSLYYTLSLESHNEELNLISGRRRLKKCQNFLRKITLQAQKISQKQKEENMYRNTMTIVRDLIKNMLRDCVIVCVCMCTCSYGWMMVLRHLCYSTCSRNGCEDFHSALSLARFSLSFSLSLSLSLSLAW